MTLSLVPQDHVPVVKPEAVSPPVDLVRGYYRAHEAQQRHERLDRDRSDVAVLWEFAVLEGVA